MIHSILFDAVSKFDMNKVNDGDDISIRMDISDENTEIARMYVDTLENGNKVLTHIVDYKSPIEFATTSMKQVLTLYVKDKIVSMFPNDYPADSPTVHAYICRLPYESIKYIAQHVEEFAKQFHDDNITMKIPRTKFDQ